jgi:tetratricopeptide (TPR) repeat protein
MSTIRQSSDPPAARLVALDRAAPTVLASGYAPSISTLHSERAGILTELGRHSEAGAETELALGLAIAAGDDELAARAGISRLRLAFMAGERDLDAIETVTRSAVDHLANPAMAAELEVARASLLTAVDRDPEAITLLRDAIATYERIAIADHVQLVTALQLLSSPLQTIGDLDGAQAVLDRSVEVGRKRYGEDNVDIWYLRSGRAANTAYRGDLAASAAELADAVAHLASADPTDPRVAHVQTQHCATQLALTRAKAVPACELAVRGTVAAFGPDHPQVIWPLTLLGQGQIAADDLAGAIATLENAVRIGEKGQIGPRDLLISRAFLSVALSRSDRRRAHALAVSLLDELAVMPNSWPTRAAVATVFPDLAKRLGIKQ